MSNIEIPNLNTDKLKIFYRRISTFSQNLQGQIAGEEAFRDMYPEEEIIIIEDIGVSANKVKIENRPGLVQAIELIKSGQADTLFVYDRSRLARNFYEYMRMVDLFLKSNLSVNFTTNHHYDQFSDSVLTEGMNAILIDEEGNNIARNTANRNQKYPNAKFGYSVNGRKNKTYEVKEEYRFLIADLFHEIAKRISEEQVIMIAQKYQKLLRRKDLRDVFKILCDPFYAAYEIYSDDHFQPLSHVEPIISLEEFKAVFKDGERHVLRIQRNAEEMKSSVVMTPICAKCDKEMNFKLDHSEGKSHFQCGRGHKKRMVKTDDFNRALVESIKAVLLNLNTNRLRKDCAFYISQIIKDTSMKIKEKQSNLSQLHMKLALSDPKEQNGNFLNQMSAKIKTEKLEIKTLTTHISLLKENLMNVNYIVDEVTSKGVHELTESSLPLLSPLFIKQVTIDDENNYLIYFYFNEFISQEVDSLPAS